jgi:hypothetical protein
MAGKQRHADIAIERAILVLGLAGVVAIFEPFAFGYSPWTAVPRYYSGSAAALREALNSGEGIVSFVGGAAAFTVFFVAPLLSLAQLSRCFTRPLSRVERAVLVAVAGLAAFGCLGLLGFDLYARASLKDVVVGLGVWQVTVAAILLWIAIVLVLIRVRKRLRSNAAECMLLSAYVGGVATWAVLLVGILETTAAVAGFACVVHAVSVWRRFGESRGQI